MRDINEDLEYKATELELAMMSRKAGATIEYIAANPDVFNPEYIKRIRELLLKKKALLEAAVNAPITEHKPEITGKHLRYIKGGKA